MWIGRACVSIAMLTLTAACLSQVLTVGSDGKTQTSTLSPAQKAILLPALQDATGEHGPDLLQFFTVFSVPLAEKGAAAIFAIAANARCGGAHSNCIFLVFRQEAGGDIPILNAAAGDYDLESHRHMGYRDIVLKNYQGVHTMVSIWQYDGRKYRVHACTDETSQGTRKRVPADQCESQLSAESGSRLSTPPAPGRGRAAGRAGSPSIAGLTVRRGPGWRA